MHLRQTGLFRNERTSHLTVWLSFWSTWSRSTYAARQLASGVCTFVQSRTVLDAINHVALLELFRDQLLLRDLVDHLLSQVLLAVSFDDSEKVIMRTGIFSCV